MPSLWHKSRSVEWDAGPYPAANAQAFFFLGGVQGSPISVYNDAAEGSPHPNPVLADGNGRWPAVYIPYMTSYGVRVLNQNNVQLWLDDFIPNPNPVEVEAPPVTEGFLETGMVHWEPVDTVRAGYVRMNGRTVGNGLSGATERANADTEDLFIFLWNAMADGQAPVLPGGRGGSGAADFAANKTIRLPDMRGGGPIGLDTMGNSAANVFGSVVFGQGSPITPGSFAGSNTFTLAVANLPAHSHTASTALAGSHSHTGATGTTSVDHTHGVNFTSGAGGTHSHGGSTDSVGTAHTHTGTTDSAGAHSHTVPADLGASNGQSGGSFFLWQAGTEATSIDGAHTHTFTTGSAGSHAHSITTTVAADHTHAVVGTTAGQSATHTHSISADGSHSHTVTVDNTGSGSATPIVSRSILGTWYIKL